MRKRSFILPLTICKIDVYRKGPNGRKGVMYLTARERILTLRLMEKVEKYPAFAKTLGIEATGAKNNQNIKSDSKGLTYR